MKSREQIQMDIVDCIQDADNQGQKLTDQTLESITDYVLETQSRVKKFDIADVIGFKATEKIKILRNLKEWWMPSKKCERVGHKIEVVELTIMKRSEYGLKQVQKCKAKRTLCTRCNTQHSDLFDIEVIKTFDSISAPSEWWAKLEKDGWALEY